MANLLLNFFYMHGYGWYVWSAYGSVFGLLTLQWFISWQRVKSLQKNVSPSESLK